MLDAVLRYLAVITVAGAAISFVIGLLKYLDQRNREERTRRYELFHDLMRRVSAKGDLPGEGLPLTQQLAAIYELQQFKEYSYASIPILDHLRVHFARSEEATVVVKAIDDTLYKLKA